MGETRVDLLHLLEEVCSHVLILKQGRKVVDGTLEEVTQRFAASGEAGDASLEEIFFRATRDAPNPPPLPQ